MGQYWKLINIDQRSELHHDGGLKLWEFVMSTSAEQLVALLKTTEWADFRIQSHLIAASKHKSSGSQLVALPQEIIDMIVALLLDNHPVQDVVCLSLTCSYFFRLLGPWLQKTLAKDFGPWAGDRLVFVGDYASGYPADVASDEEKLEWDSLGQSSLYDLPTKIAGEGKKTKPRSLYASSSFEVWGELLDQLRERLSGHLETVQLFDRLVALLMQPAETLTPAESAPVLRNLTAKEYVRDAALADSDVAYSLGEVVVIYTQWTDDPSGTEGLGMEGDWIGHRFDISNMAGVAGEEWKDVSEDALQKLDMVTGCEKKDGRRA